MLYYNVARAGHCQVAVSQWGSMPTQVHDHVHDHAHHHHHQHPAGRGHPPAAVSPSILRMALIERLAAAAVLIAVLWGAVLWAMF
jgi:hypothetical protein